VKHAAREVAYYTRIASVGVLSPTRWYGESVYDRDWDLLVVLDACRPDVLATYEDEYAFLDDGGATYSVGSYSRSWMRRTFSRRNAREVADTVYVTGNPFSGTVLDAEDFAHLDEVWRDEWNETEGTVLPDPVTNRAIRRYRQYGPDRLVVHYMQPHHPFLTDDSTGFTAESFPDPREADPWDQVRWGKRTLANVVEAYRENLPQCLDSIATLLSSVDADRVAITADHANALGERGLYGHPAYGAIDAVRRVPWYETTATDTGQYDPPEVAGSAGAATDPMDRLADLGYR
jgi:hypothetical protein